VRYLAMKTDHFGTKRVILAENPQDETYAGCIVCYIRTDDRDGPAEGGQVYEGFTIEEIILEYESDYGIARSDWIIVPDQVAGCEDAWLDPVRQVRDEGGSIIVGTWEKLIGNQWRRFKL
jgi:hypothetical protein